MRADRPTAHRRRGGERAIRRETVELTQASYESYGPARSWRPHAPGMLGKGASAVSRLLRCVLLTVSACAPLAAPALGSEHQSPASGSTAVAGTPLPSNRFTVPDRTQRTGLRVALPKPDCAA